MAASALWLLLACFHPVIARAEIGATPQGVSIAPAADEADAKPPYPTEPPPALPALENPLTGIMEAGQLIVTVSTTRRYESGPSVNYGYRLGQLIPITLVISADPHVKVDLGALMRQTLIKGESAYEVVAPPVVTKENKNGKNITIVQLVVRTWKIENVVPFNCQFHYATGFLPDGKSPDWKLATTPDFNISMSRTATESSKELLPGDGSVKVTARVWWSKPLEIGGAVVMALVPLWLAYRFWLLYRNANMATRARRAWSVIDKMLSERENAGHEEFSPTQLKVISAALREYLSIESIPTQMAHEPLERFFETRDRSAVPNKDRGAVPNKDRNGDMKALCISALSKLDRAIYSQSALTVEETNALIAEISRIIPRD